MESMDFSNNLPIMLKNKHIIVWEKMSNTEYLIVMVQTKGRKTGWVGKICNGTEEDCGWVVGHVINEQIKKHIVN